MKPDNTVTGTAVRPQPGLHLHNGRVVVSRRRGRPVAPWVGRHGEMVQIPYEYPEGAIVLGWVTVGDLRKMGIDPQTLERP